MLKRKHLRCDDKRLIIKIAILLKKLQRYAQVMFELSADIDTLHDSTTTESTQVTHLDETSHMSAEFVFHYGQKCMGGLILPILVLLHL